MFNKISSTSILVWTLFKQNYRWCLTFYAVYKIFKFEKGVIQDISIVLFVK